jgi:hypothetical protein
MGPRTPSRAWLLGALLFVILGSGFGLIAAWITSPSHAAPAYYFDSLPVTAGTATFLSYLFLGGFLAYFGYRLYQRLAGKTLAYSPRALTTVLVVLGLLTLFVVVGPLLAHASHPGPGTLTSNTGSRTDGNPTAPGGPNSSVSSYSPSAPEPAPPMSWSSVLIDLGLGAAGAAGLVAGWAVIARWRDAREGASRSGAERVRREMSTALTALDHGTEDVQRRAILRVYASLLDSLTRMRQPVEVFTPREIERELGSKFRIDPDASSRLTAIFEEARYSTHVLAPGQAAEAAAMFRRMLSGFPPPVSFR